MHFPPLLLLVSAVLGLDVTILSPSGAPLGHGHVSIAGRSATIPIDGTGTLTLPYDLETPFTMIVVGPDGELYSPVEIIELAELSEVRLQIAVTESLTVTAGVAPNITSTPASATATVELEELRQRQPEHLVDALERVPSVLRGGAGPAAVPVVRGMTGGRTLLLHDDTRVTTERRAGPSGTFLDPFTLGSLEISRGPGSVAYGSDAFGGVIHARPREPLRGENDVRYQMSISQGGSDLVAAGVSITRDLLGGALLISVHGRDSEGSASKGGAPILNSGYRDHGASLRFSRLGSADVVRLGLTMNVAQDVEVPAADADLVQTSYPKESSTRLSFGWDSIPEAWADSIELRAGLSSYAVRTSRERLAADSVPRQIRTSDVTANDASVRMVAAKNTAIGRARVGTDLTSRFGLRAEGELRQYALSGELLNADREVSIGDASKVDAGIFAILDGSWSSSIHGSVGARVDWIDTRSRGGYHRSDERQSAAVSGHAALMASSPGGWTGTLQIASGFRDPSLSDRYFRGVTGRGFVTGNPFLEPERSLQLDATVRWQRGAPFVGLAMYEYRIRSVIERYREGPNFLFRNRGESRVQGIELEAAVPLPHGLSLHGHAVVARGRFIDDDHPLDDVAAPMLHLATAWEGKRLSAFLHGFWFAADDRAGPVEVARPAHTTFDAGVGWNLSRALELRMLIRNLTDRLYAASADANAADAPGRSLALSVGGRL